MATSIVNTNPLPSVLLDTPSLRGGRTPPLHVLATGLFTETIVRERKRAERSGLPFSVLLLERGDSSLEAGPWVPVLRALAGMTRAHDIVGWLEPRDVLAVLLPQTTGNAALHVVERLQLEIVRQRGDVPLPAPTMHVYTVGSSSGVNGTELRSVDVLLRRIVQDGRHKYRDAAKRGLDIVGSALFLAFFAPLLLLIYAAVKLTSPGPALYRQIRVGRSGRPFTMFKFRTMYANAGHAIHQDYMAWFIKSSGRQPHTGNELFKLANDPRITRVGHFLRKTSLDELPQFWNVLRGDMSLVGPRPPLPFEVEQYQAWHRRRVLEATPGITGPWQINGRSRTTFDDMVRLDLRYAKTHSLWTDIKILAATPRAMVSGKGAC